MQWRWGFFIYFKWFPFFSQSLILPSWIASSPRSYGIKKNKKKTARIKKASLERVKSDGGLGLPNFLFYYWAANVKLTYWITTFADKEGPVWADMELRASLPVSPISILTPLPLNIKVPELNSNLVIQNSIKIWGQFRKHFNLTNICSFFPIMSNHLSAPSLIDQAFVVWHKRDLVYFQDLFAEDGFASF